MHDSGFTDVALAAVAKGCQQLAYLSMRGPPLSLARPGGGTPQQPSVGTVTDAGLKAIALHCTMLKGLSVTCNAHISDQGVASLAEAPAAVLQQLQEFAWDAIRCTWEGVQLLLQRCTGLRKVELYGLQPSLCGTE